MLTQKEQTTLYNQYKQTAIKTLRRTYMLEDAEEIYNNAMLKAFLKYDQLNDKNIFGIWFNTIVKREAITYIRSKYAYNKPKGHIDIDLIQDDHVLDLGYTDTLTQIENQNTINTYLNLLSPKSKNIMEKYIEGYTYKDISKETGIKSGTLKWYVSDARRIINSTIKLKKWSK